MTMERLLGKTNAIMYLSLQKIHRKIWIQYCLKSELAFQMISEDKNNLLEVDYRKFNKQYMERDSKARNRMRELIDSRIGSKKSWRAGETCIK